MASLEDVLDEVIAQEQAEDDGDLLEDAAEALATGGDALEVSEEEACGLVETMADDELVVSPTGAGEGVLPGDFPSSARGGLVTVGKLDGVPLFYARGGAPRPAQFSMTPGFRDHLTSTIKLVRRRAPKRFGELVRITSAGAFVDKPGFHGLGRAFDHDVWHFEHVEIAPLKGDHAAPALARRQRYWALAAFLRSRSAFVLHGHYDAAHRDHIHSDDGGPFGFTPSSEATVKLVQAVCNEIHRTSPKLLVDGDFGPASRAAVQDAMRALRVEGQLTDARAFRAFLRGSGRLGFRLSLDD